VAELNWNKEQREAIDRIRGWVDKSEEGLELSLTGAAGTGKSSLMKAIVPFLGEEQVAWTAMTGRAALRLSSLIELPATTLHSRLYDRPNEDKKGRLWFNRVKPADFKYLIIDEASMLPPKIYDDLRGWVMQGVRILYVGDGYQLPPVMSYAEIKERGEDFSIFREVPGPALKQVMRSDDDIIVAATQLRHEGQVPKKSFGGYRIKRSKTPGTDAIEEFLMDNDDHFVITWRNRLRMKANHLVRKRLGFSGLLPNDGEPIMVCKNGASDGKPPAIVLNGEIHWGAGWDRAPKLGPEVETHWLYTDHGVRILVNTQGKDEPMDGMMPIVDDWKEYMRQRKIARLPEIVPITYGYVGTAHKVQGEEFRKVTIFLSREDLANDKFRKDTYLPDGTTMPFANRWAYTSLTRAKKEVTLILGS